MHSNIEFTSKAVWVAEDDPDDKLIIGEAFEENNFRVPVVYFDDGEQVVSKINNILQEDQSNLPVLMIIDLNMPKVNGHELLKILKNNIHTMKIPIVILTTSRSSQDKEKLLKLGASDFITKPIQFSLMIQIVNDLIKRYVAE